jgi:DNA-binding NarL/FixJ family response regulator
MPSHRLFPVKEGLMSALDPGQRARTTIVIVDDHDIVRHGVRAVLEKRPDFEIVGEANDGARGLDMIKDLKPRVAILDYSLPTMNGAQIARHVRVVSPATEVLIFSMHDSDLLVREVLDAGARGFLLKSDASTRLVDAVEAMSRGQAYFTGRVTESLLQLYLAQPAEHDGLSTLTPREREVVQVIAEGKSSKEAGSILGLKLKTVEAHRAAAMHKLGLSTTAALVRYAVRNKLVEP